MEKTFIAHGQKVKNRHHFGHFGAFAIFDFCGNLSYEPSAGILTHVRHREILISRADVVSFPGRRMMPVCAA
jgi:hypothetical protein